jgi:hypothetical protein
VDLAKVFHALRGLPNLNRLELSGLYGIDVPDFRALPPQIVSLDLPDVGGEDWEPSMLEINQMLGQLAQASGLRDLSMEGAPLANGDEVANLTLLSSDLESIDLDLARDSEGEDLDFAQAGRLLRQLDHFQNLRGLTLAGWPIGDPDPDSDIGAVHSLAHLPRSLTELRVGSLGGLDTPEHVLAARQEIVRQQLADRPDLQLRFI